MNKVDGMEALDALKKRPEPPKTGDPVRVVRCRVCQYCDRFAPEEGEYGCCELTGAIIARAERRCRDDKA